MNQNCGCYVGSLDPLLARGSLQWKANNKFRRKRRPKSLLSFLSGKVMDKTKSTASWPSQLLRNRPFSVPTQRKSKNLAKTKKHHPWAAPVVHCYIQESFREPPRCSGDEEIQFLSRVGHFLIEHSNANKRRGIQFRISSHLEPFVVELFCLKSESIVYWQKDQPFESPPKMLLFNGQQNSERVETKDVSSQNVWKPRHILLYKNRVSKALQVREEARL